MPKTGVVRAVPLCLGGPSVCGTTAGAAEGSMRLEPRIRRLVELDPTIKLDIRYAGTNNFLGKPVYKEARAFLQRPAADALVAATVSSRAMATDS